MTLFKPRVGKVIFAQTTGGFAVIILFFFFFSGFSSPHSCEFVFVFVYMISEREK